MLRPRQITACLPLLAIPMIGGVSHAYALSRPVIFAHYMPCYDLGSSAVKQSIAPPDEVANMLQWPPTQQVSEWFSPALAALAGTGTRATAQEFALAHSAGIDAFGVMVTTGDMARSSLFGVLDDACVEAGQSTVKVIPEIWADPWTDDFALSGSHLEGYMEKYPNSFITRNGKPVLIFDFSPSTAEEQPSEQLIAYHALEDFAKPWGGLNNVYAIVYVPADNVGLDGDSKAVTSADAVDNWTPQDDWSATFAEIGPEVARALEKDIVWPVSPAFYQRRAGQPPAEYGNSLGAARYIDGWMNGMKAVPDLIDVQTWNDFSEDTAIVPTNAAGSAWLDLTSYFSTWAKTGTAPTVTAEKVMIFHPKQLVSAKLQFPKATVVNASWRHDTPTVDYTDVVTCSKSYPANGDYRTVKTTTSFQAATPIVTVARGGSVITRLSSKIPFLSTGVFQDFTIIGDEAVIGGG